MRYRAKPFTVEVKRSNKRVPLTVATATSFPSERHRRDDQLLFGGLSSRLELAGRLGDGRLTTDEADVKPQAPAAEAVTSEIHVKAIRVRPTGRILPDLLEQSRAEMRLRHELDEREALRAQKPVSRPSFGSRPKWAKVQADVEAHAERKPVLDPIPAVGTVSVKEPVLAPMEVTAPAAVEPITAPSPTPPSGPRQPTGTARGNSTSGANQAWGHKSERLEACMLLRAGEKWKRRLPRVCW